MTSEYFCKWARGKFHFYDKSLGADSGFERLR